MNFPALSNYFLSTMRNLYNPNLNKILKNPFNNPPNSQQNIENQLLPKSESTPPNFCPPAIDYREQRFRHALSVLLSGRETADMRLKMFKDNLSNAMTDGDIEILNSISKTELYVGFREFFEDIREIRNDFNHAGFGMHSKPYVVIFERFKINFDKFIEVLSSNKLL
jgi:hypothetical protein